MIDREAENTINEVAQAFKVLLVTGPRQVGKTTLLKSIMPDNMNYVSLDDKLTRELAQNDPKLFLEEHPYPLLIDEVQYAPNLFSYIKIKVDEIKEPSMYWLTGSQQFKLMKNVQESLAGRVGIVKLNSLTYNEINNRKLKKEMFDPKKIIDAEIIGVNDLYENIFKGGMPEIYVNDKMKRIFFFNSYIETYLTKDVENIISISNMETFKNFMITIASRNGEQLNYSKIGSEVGITDKTVKSWLNILVTSGIIYLLTPYNLSREKRVNHMPKIIWMDSGLCSFLAGYEDARTLQMSSNAGHYLESYIISEIVKSYNSHGLEANISYFRDKDKHEIDLVFFNATEIYPFEIKKTASPNKEMISSFKYLKDSKKKVMPGGIICLCDKLMRIEENNYCIPVSSVINLKK
mgnify:FL=1